jgi:tetratricopeptide (TPR) repeat protein
MRNGVVLLALAILASEAASQGINKEKLRQAARMPEPSLLGGVSFHPIVGFYLLFDPPDVRPEIAGLRKALKNDAKDAERWFRLGQLYDWIGDEKEGRSVWARATRLYRARLAASPDNSKLLRRLALCLEDGNPEQETLLRRAIKIGPGDWEAWAALGEQLVTRAHLSLLSEKDKADGKFHWTFLATNLEQLHPPPDRADRALRLLDEARVCFNKEQATIPPDSRAYARLGMHLMAVELFQSGLRSARGEDVNPATTTFTPEQLACFRRASELSPGDDLAVGFVLGNEVLGELARHMSEQGNNKKHPWDLLPADVQRSIAAKWSRLEQFARGPDRDAAARSSELLACLCQMLKEDSGQSLVWSRRAIEMDPNRENAWAVYLWMLCAEHRFKEFFEAAKKRLQQKDSAYIRYLLAVAHERSGQFNEAEVEVRAALKLVPEDMMVNLGLAALLLRHSERDESLAEAGRLMDRVETVLPSTIDVKLKLNYLALRGIYFGLRGDREAACRLLSEVLETDKNHDAASAALVALGEPPVPLPPVPWSAASSSLERIKCGPGVDTRGK